MVKGFCPFRRVQASEIKYKAFQIPGVSTLYLQKLGYTRVIEALSSQDEKKLEEQLSSQTLILKTVASIMEKENCSYKEANNRLFGIKTKTITNDDGSQEVVPEDESSELAMFRYMGEDGYKQLLRAMAKKSADRELVESVATGMIQSRTLYPVIVAEKARAKSDEIKVTPTLSSIPSGYKLQFGDYSFTVAESVAEGDDTITISEQLPTRLNANEVGFICKPSGSPLVGVEWQLQNTRDYLPDAPIDVAQEIYDFYMQERGMASAEEDTDMDLGKSERSLIPSKNERQESPLTGTQSTGNAASTDYPQTIPDSAQENLEISLSG